jgi:YVTN family beta-propeller protein
VAITRDGKHAYVTNFGDDTVSVITMATGAVSAPITVGKAAAGVAICPAPIVTMAAAPPAFLRRKPTIALSGYRLPEL